VCAQRGHDVIIAADDAALGAAAAELRQYGTCVTSVACDLSTAQGCASLAGIIDAAQRPVDVLCANAGRGLGAAFLDQDMDAVRGVVHTNIDGTLRLIHHVGGRMRARHAGRMLVTGSIAGLVPGPFNAVYNATKAFIDSFCMALRAELEGSGVTVTCLYPGATATNVFARSDLEATAVAENVPKADPADVARAGYEAMMAGQAKIVHGVINKLLATAAEVVPDRMLAAVHRGLVAPGSAKR